LRARHPGSGVGGRSRPGKESVAKRSLACLRAMQQLGVLGGLLPVAREAAEVPGDGRVRVPGENTILRDGELRSFAAGARVVVVRQHVEKLAPGGVGGPLDVGCVDVERVMIGTGSDRAAGHAGVGDRPVSRGGAGDRLCCVREESKIGHAAQNRAGRLSDSGRSLDGRPGRISRAAIATLRELGADWSTWPLASTAWSAPPRRAFARLVSAAPSGAS